LPGHFLYIMNIARTSKKTKIAKKLLQEKSCRSCSFVLNRKPCIDTKRWKKPHRVTCAAHKESLALADPVMLPLRKLEIYYRNIEKKLTKIALVSVCAYAIPMIACSILHIIKDYPANKWWLLIFAYLPVYVIALVARNKVSKKAADMGLQQREKAL